METKKDYHAVVEWDDADIKERLGELTVELGKFAATVCGEMLAVNKEIDCLAFELHCREKEK